MGNKFCKPIIKYKKIVQSVTGSTECDQNVIERDNEMPINPAMYINKKYATLSDKYHRVTKIGSGAYGQVMLCRDKITGIERAVKIIRKSEGSDINPDKLIAEVELLKSLDHPNIAKLYEFFEDSRKYYLVMDLYKGGELFDEIIRRQKFSEQDAANIMKQILGGVFYLHNNNIVHRDLKPENLLLESNKPDALIKIVDFGLSAYFDGSRMMERLGTPYYIAPEVLDKCYNEKCDIWSCGVILYILLCGYPPFGGQTDEEILSKVERGKCVFDMNDWSNVSEEARALVKAMLTYDPASRISAKEALMHPWFKLFSENKTPVSLGEVSNALTNMKKFQASQKLASAALYFIANRLTTLDETNQLTNIFHELDIDGDGRLDRNELIAGYSKLVSEWGITPEDVEKDVDAILAAVDLDNNGYMDYSEFVVACMDKSMLLSRERMQIAFNLFDSDNSGKISKGELAKIFGLTAVDDQIWNEILSTTDANNDGEVDFEEFEKMMQNICKIPAITA